MGNFADVTIADGIHSVGEHRPDLVDASIGVRKSTQFLLVHMTEAFECRADDIAEIIVQASRVPTEPFSWNMSSDILRKFRRRTLDFSSPYSYLAVERPSQMDDAEKIAVTEDVDPLTVRIVGVFFAEEITDTLHECLESGVERWPEETCDWIEELKSESLGFLGRWKMGHKNMSLWLASLRERGFRLVPGYRVLEFGLSAILPDAYGNGLVRQFQSKILTETAFSMCVTLCSNEFSATAARRCSREICALEFDEFEVEGQFPFRGSNQCALEYVRSDPSRKGFDSEEVATHFRLFEGRMTDFVKKAVSRQSGRQSRRSHIETPEIEAN